MSLTPAAFSRVSSRLADLYGDGQHVRECLKQIAELARNFTPPTMRMGQGLWDERDVVLITYGDQVRSDEGTTLGALKSFLTDNGLDQSLRLIHLLPCFPYSSDDGFSVIDYQTIDPALGDWSDVDDLRPGFELMFDLVLNHCSVQHEWFQKYLQGEEPYCRYFTEVDPETDLSEVTRPRSLPLLTAFDTSRGQRHVWTTFSADQVDLNFGDPAVLVEMLAVLLHYVEQGARIIRLDAIAYLWKEIGTSCIHQSRTHTVVKLMRDILDVLAPGTILLTETNVPHDENVSYFGDCDEAHMVYQFSLSPLLLDALLTGDASPLKSWLASLQTTTPLTTYFNFTASHDGIGVRPLEGLVSQERLDALVEAIRHRGGEVSMKQNPDGSESPYELNTTYFSALASTDDKESDEIQIQRFLASQAIMLALRGIPGIYFHSLVGSENDVAGFEATGRARSLNRKKFHRSDLDRVLTDSQTVQSRVFEAYKRMLAIRVDQPAFHPNASQEPLEVAAPAVVAFTRRSLDESQLIIVLANVSDQSIDVDTSDWGNLSLQRDLLAEDTPSPPQATYHLAPYQVAWFEATTA